MVLVVQRQLALNQGRNLAVQSGEEAYFEFTTGTATGDADETEIYYRAAGTSGWTDKWDLCSGTDCAPATQYFSHLATPSILFQLPEPMRFWFGIHLVMVQEQAQVAVWCMLTQVPQPEPFKILIRFETCIFGEF